MLTIKSYENREIHRVEVFINDGVGMYAVGEQNIAKIIDASEEFPDSMHRIYVCLDENDKILQSIENCNVVVYYREVK
jgi:hypothetical protein